MNKHIITFLLLVFPSIMWAQDIRLIEQKGVKLEITNVQIGLGFKAYSHLKVGAEFSLGLANLNQDFIYDDYMLQLKLYYSALKTNRSNIYGGLI